MSKKRGLAIDEKRRRMLEIFYDKKDFFLLKEIERIASKEKGIVLQSVKDILQSLVDDDLVDSDKIGTSLYFWAFPSKARAIRKRKHRDLCSKVQEGSDKLKTINCAIDELSKKRQESLARKETLKRLKSLKTKKDELDLRLKEYKDGDPQVLKELENGTQISKIGANRWTDNVFALHSWIRNKFPSVSINDLNKQFGIPEDIDYIE